MFGGRDEASLDNGIVVEEEKVGQGIPRGELNDEESIYTRGEQIGEQYIRETPEEPNREEHIRKSREEPTREEHIRKTREEEIAVEAANF